MYVVDADLACSTQTKMFGDKFPERFVNVGCAEQDLIGTAAGLAMAGNTVFASTHAFFATARPWDQIRTLVAHDKLDVKIAASHGGMTNVSDGFTHHALEDIAIMRVIPNMNVVVPADFPEARSAVMEIADKEGPYYIRFNRTKTPVIFDADHKYSTKLEPIEELGSDCVIVATGTMVAPALDAVKELKSENTFCTLLNASTIKPLDNANLEKFARTTGAVVTVEEHSVIGGLGSAVAEVLSDCFPVPVRRVGVKDTFTQSGSPEDLYKHYGLTKEDIIKAVRHSIACRS
jgi:transketolase